MSREPGGRARSAARAARRLAARAAAPVGRWALPEAKSASEQWLRQVMNREIAHRVAALGPSAKSAVEISGDAHRSDGWREFTVLQQPEFDLCAPLQHAGRYDVVICEQVIEHVADPFAAAANLRELCVSGGTAIVSTPFLVRVHELPEYGMADYWRFTPRGLQALLAKAGFTEIEIRSWGNRECVVGNFDRWAASKPWQPLRNEPELPVQVWAFARNPG